MNKHAKRSLVYLVTELTLIILTFAAVRWAKENNGFAYGSYRQFRGGFGSLVRE